MTNSLTRRGLMGLGLGAGLAAGCSPTEVATGRNDAKAARGHFEHGVASGDPYKDSVVLWTRVSPDVDGDISVIWEMAEGKDFAALAATGTFITHAARDYTVKIVAPDLEAGTWYYYRFRTDDKTSPVGRTRTLPSGDVDRLRLAVVSCANWQHGYFNTYDAVAKIAATDPYDALIHLGDYYYEYAALPETILPDRIHIPTHEIVTLTDYRQRHAQYRSDAALQSATSAMPLIAVWDDHETSNDSWATGAENHQAGEGDWDTRKQAALRAYYEWMPVREPSIGRVREEIYRNFDFGNLLSLTCVETRLNARSEPIIIENYIDEIEANGPDDFVNNVLRAPGREMFGADQQDWIIGELTRSKADGIAWRLLANQVIMGRLMTPDFAPYISEEALVAIEKDWAGARDFMTLSKYNMPVYPDSWDGYPLAREKFYAALGEAGVEDMLVLTGDAHEFWVNELTSEAGEKRGVELVTSSVSSQTLTAYLGESTAEQNLLLTQSNADARYYNATHSGFIDLTIKRDAIAVRMVGISTVTSRDYSVFDTARFTLKKSGETIKVTSPKGLSITQRALFHGLG